MFGAISDPVMVKSPVNLPEPETSSLYPASIGLLREILPVSKTFKRIV